MNNGATAEVSFGVKGCQSYSAFAISNPGLQYL